MRYVLAGLIMIGLIIAVILILVLLAGFDKWLKQYKKLYKIWNYFFGAVSGVLVIMSLLYWYLSILEAL